MGAPSKQVRAFMETYSIDSDEVWEVRSGGAWAVKHAALERVAAAQKISFDPPIFVEADGANKIATILITGHMGDRKEWSVGEAAPHNNKNGYTYAMAEKRGKDRVILKLLNSHGALYSDSEADDFAKRPNPHVTKPDDLVPTVEYDDHGEPVDNIPSGDTRITQLPKTKAKNEYAILQAEMLAIKAPDALKKWGAANSNRVASLSSDWQSILRGQYSEHLAAIIKQFEAA